MYTFDSVTIKAFRGLRDLELDGLGRVNLLVGANNTGKTSVLEAMALLCRPRDPVGWVSIPTDRDSHLARQSIVEAVGWLFPASDRGTSNGAPRTFSPIEMHCHGDCRLRAMRAEAEERESFTVDPDNEDAVRADRRLGLTLSTSDGQQTLFGDFDWTSTPHVIRDGGSIRRRGGDLEYVVTHCLTWPADVRSDPSFVRFWSRLSHEQQQEVVQLVQSFDGGIEALALNDPDVRGAIMVAEHKELGRIPLGAYGDGMRRAVQLSTALVVSEAGVLLVDEIESSLHYQALQEMFAWLVQGCRQYNVQLFATTHSDDAIDAMLSAVEPDWSDLVGYRLRRQGPDVTAQRLDGEMLYRLRFQRGLEVR